MIFSYYIMYPNQLNYESTLQHSNCFEGLEVLCCYYASFEKYIIIQKHPNYYKSISEPPKDRQHEAILKTIASTPLSVKDFRVNFLFSSLLLFYVLQNCKKTAKKEFTWMCGLLAHQSDQRLQVHLNYGTCVIFPLPMLYPFP